MTAMRKWLSIAAALAVPAALSAVLLGSRALNRLVRNDVRALFSQAAPTTGGIVTQAMLQDLPEPVRRYLTYTGVIGKPPVRTVHLRQKGKMRLGASQPWLLLDAEQHYSVRPPGFVWSSTIHLGPLPLARARDRYLDGNGNMLVKAGSLVTVTDATGAEMDQGSMMRYLSEMIWFPAAFLGDNIAFAPIDDKAARVTLTDCGRSATAIMYFDQQGRLTNVVAERYRMAGQGSALETWSTPVVEYGELAGLRLPVRGKAVWMRSDGDFDYLDVTITELDYNLDSPDAALAVASTEPEAIAPSGAGPVA
jgi:hypothetical protein